MNKFTCHWDVWVHPGVYLCLQKELRETQQRLEAAEEKLAELESADSELQKLRKDQEDLLELLTDQDTRLNQLKAQLRALGEKASHTFTTSWVVLFLAHCVSEECLHCPSSPPSHGDWSGSHLRSDKSSETLGSHGSDYRLLWYGIHAVYFGGYLPEFWRCLLEYKNEPHKALVHS